MSYRGDIHVSFRNIEIHLARATFLANVLGAQGAGGLASGRRHEQERSKNFCFIRPKSDFTFKSKAKLFVLQKQCKNVYFRNVLEHWGQARPVVAQRSRSGRACALAQVR